LGVFNFPLSIRVNYKVSPKLQFENSKILG